MVWMISYVIEGWKSKEKIDRRKRRTCKRNVGGRGYVMLVKNKTMA